MAGGGRRSPPPAKGGGGSNKGGGQGKEGVRVSSGNGGSTQGNGGSSGKGLAVNFEDIREGLALASALNRGDGRLRSKESSDRDASRASSGPYSVTAVPRTSSKVGEIPILKQTADVQSPKNHDDGKRPQAEDYMEAESSLEGSEETEESEDDSSMQEEEPAEVTAMDMETIIAQGKKIMEEVKQSQNMKTGNRDGSVLHYVRSPAKLKAAASRDTGSNNQVRINLGNLDYENNVNWMNGGEGSLQKQCPAVGINAEVPSSAGGTIQGPQGTNYAETGSRTQGICGNAAQPNLFSKHHEERGVHATKVRGAETQELGHNSRTSMYGGDRLGNIIQGGTSNGGPDNNRRPNAWARPKHIPITSIVEPESFVEDDGTVTLDDECARNNISKLEKALVGKLLGRHLPYAVLKMELSRKWAHFGLFKITTVSNDCFICTFENVEARDAVLMGGPWFVAGTVIGLDVWRPSFSPDSLSGFTAPIWVRLPNLPLTYWDQTNIIRIASQIGQPLWLDASTDAWERNNYARVCVRVDLSLQLSAGVWVRGLGGRFFQEFIYEGISHLCFQCGKVGHKASGCPERKDKEATITEGQAGNDAAFNDGKKVGDNHGSYKGVEKSRHQMGDANNSNMKQDGLRFSNGEQVSSLGNAKHVETGHREVGPWTLVSHKKKAKANTKATGTILPADKANGKNSGARDVIRAGRQQPDNGEEHTVNRRPNSIAISPGKADSGEHLIFNADPRLRVRAPEQKSKHRISKPLSEKDSDGNELGIEEKKQMRKRKKNKGNKTNGGDASPSGY